MQILLRKIDQKDYRGAHALCLDMIRANVHDPEPYHALGRIALEHGNHRKALELHQKAATLGPEIARYHAAYAQILSVIGRHDDAMQAAENAARLKISDPVSADIVAVVYSRAGFHERAIPFFQKAIELNPAPANFHYNLGASLQFSGQFHEAKQAYKAALERDPSLFRAFTSLVTLEKQTAENNQLEKLTGFYDQHQNDANAALHIGHAIAKTCEDLGEYDQSLMWLKKAKALNLKRYPVTENEQQALFKVAEATAELVKAAPSTGNTVSDAPIFVVGLPRTGTTLVDRILSSHPDVTAAGELNVFADLVKRAADTRENTVLDAETLAAANRLDYASIGQHYIDRTRKLARGTKRFTDKMPLNFFYAAMILKAMPNARIIALRRDAADSCISNYRQLFSTQFSYYNYTYCLESTARFYRGFDALMHHWRANLPANRFTEIHYEHIVSDQENQTRRLLEFCDLGWHEGCLRFHENSAPVSTASSVQVRQPLYSGSIGRWKRYSTGLEKMMETLGPLAPEKAQKTKA